MKTVTPTLLAHLQSAGTCLATCWRITRNDGTQWGYTAHDQLLTIAALAYQPQSGFQPSAVDTKEGLSVDNMEVDALVLSAEFSEAELLAGRWDYARVEIFQVNYTQPNAGTLLLRRGTLGEVSFSAQDQRNSQSGTYKAELRGLLQPLSQVIGEVVSKLCRASLGDARCGVNLPALTVAAVVASINAANTVIGSPALTQPAGYFDYGLLTFTTGPNAGYATEVHGYTPGVLQLFQPLAYTPAVGDAFRLSPGCDRHFGTCIGRFANAVNFRGEPHLPGQDKLMQNAR